MQINDVKNSVENLWSDVSASWQDDIAKKYKTAMIDPMENILNSMQCSCNQLMFAKDEALRRLNEIQE